MGLGLSRWVMFHHNQAHDSLEREIWRHGLVRRWGLERSGVRLIAHHLGSYHVAATQRKNCGGGELVGKREREREMRIVKLKTKDKLLKQKEKTIC